MSTKCFTNSENIHGCSLILSLMACQPSLGNSSESNIDDTTAVSTTEVQGPATSTGEAEPTEGGIGGSGSSNSTLPEPSVCGDGMVDETELCDDGSDNGAYGHCGADCAGLGPRCGDGIVDEVEACDDGNLDDTDACTSTCTQAVCGDAIVQLAEECDDGMNGIQDDACTDGCTSPACGDGFIQDGEACDDGNSESEDGCDVDCQQTSKTVFITSESYSGDFGGAFKADLLCQVAAQAAGLQGTYRAWLGDGQISPAKTFEHSPYRYVLPSGKLIANDFADLSDGVLEHAVNEDESGTKVPSNASAWTNTNSKGVASALNCGGWVTKDGFGLCGRAWALDDEWVNYTLCICAAPYRFYCVEQ